MRDADPPDVDIVSASRTRFLTPALSRVVRSSVAEVLNDRGLDLGLEDPLELSTAEELLEFAFELVSSDLAGPRPPRADRLAELSASLLMLMRARRQVGAAGLGARQHALASAHEALAHLRGLGSVDDVMAQAVINLASYGDFDRAAMFAVADGALSARAIEVHANPDAAKQLTDALDRAQATGAAAEALRRRVPILVPKGNRDPGLATSLARLHAPEGFAVAPVAPDDVAIALLYVDRGLSNRQLDGLDRDLLWTFAEGFGYALERAGLVERIHVLRAEFRRFAAAGDDAIAELCAMPVSLHSGSRKRAADALTTFVQPEPESLRDELLSVREREILAFLSEGARNRDIARRLCISEETVKSHVRRILRKLHAANRTEAVSRYQRLTARRLTPRSGSAPG